MVKQSLPSGLNIYAMHLYSDINGRKGNINIK